MRLNKTAKAEAAALVVILKDGPAPNDNDLVWVGRAANYAAKLTTLSDEFAIWITGSVYDSLQDAVKFANKTNMWKEHSWTPMNKMRIYACGAWKIDV